MFLLNAGRSDMKKYTPPKKAMLRKAAYPPREVLSEPLQITGDITPLRHVVTMIQDPWLGLGYNLNEMLIVSGFIVVATILAIRLFRWE